MCEESIQIVDEIVGSADHMNDLRSELALEMVENMREMLKKLKVCYNLNEEITPAQKREIAVLYTNAKDTVLSYDAAVDDFKYSHLFGSSSKWKGFR